MTPNIDYHERMVVIGARINRGQDTYAGRLDAWHSLGNVSGKFQTLEEIMVAGKATYDVIVKQLDFHGKLVDAWGTFRIDDSPVKGIEDKAILVKSEKTGVEKYLTFLAPVGQGYQVIHHRTMGEVLDSLVADIDGAHYETLVTLDYGRVVAGQVNPNFQIRVGEDISDVYLSFVTSHDGSKASEVYETAIRQVCRNTVRLGQLKKLSNSLRVKHTKNAQKKIDGWKAELAEIRDVAMTMQERLNYLAAKKVTRQSLDTIMNRLFPQKKDAEGVESSSTRRENIIAEILATYEDNDGNQFPEQRGTAYNLLNAITNYTDHSRSTKGDMRAESALFGSGDKLKTNALSVILDVAEGMPEVLARQQGHEVDWESVGIKLPSMSN